MFYKSEVSILWGDLGTKYFRLKRKGHALVKQCAFASFLSLFLVS